MHDDLMIDHVEGAKLEKRGTPTGRYYCVSNYIASKIARGLTAYMYCTSSSSS